MSPSPARRSLLHIHHLFGRRRRGESSSSGNGNGMGCAQGKPSRGSPARSDGPRGIDRLMRDNEYRPASGASRLSDPLPVVSEWRPPAAHARPGPAADTGTTNEKKRTPPMDEDDDAAANAPATTNAAATTPPPPPPPPNPPRREDELVDGWPTWLLDNVPREALNGIVPKSADAYDKIEKVGQGTYSNVYKARERGTGRIVALKKVRFDTSESESVRFMAREIRILQLLDHPNVIRLEGIATSRMHRSIYLVFEFMYSDLARLVARAGDQRLTEPQIKSYMQQLLSGLHHCHERGILHRDIKGSNLLIDRHGVLKIGDFGLANYYGGARRRPLTSRVVTLWYRAPELLLSATDYGVGIDLWSAGCLLAEMFFGKPLMPGRTEVEQLYRIFTLCGSPPDEYWRKQKASATFRPTKAYKSTMAERLRGLPPSARSLISTLLALDPAARGTAAQALQSDFFSTPPLPCDLSSLPVVYKEEEVVDPSTSHDGRKPKLRQRGSTRRKDTRPKAEEQQEDEPKINSGSPDKAEEEPPVTNAGKSAGAVVLNQSSSVQESPENAVVDASNSKLFSVSPIQITYVTQEEASPAAPQDQPPLQRAGRHHHHHSGSGSGEGHDSEDEQADGESPAIVLGRSVESRPASVVTTDYDAAVAALRESSGELPSKPYVLVDHV